MHHALQLDLEYDVFKKNLQGHIFSMLLLNWCMDYSDYKINISSYGLEISQLRKLKLEMDV